MPRASAVSEKVWAQAIHAVSVQKMSLRRAAQLYGVHHMSLHRRVRGRHLGATASSSSNNNNNNISVADEFALSRAEQDEALLVLHEQFLHEHQVTSDDVRCVVRTIASQSGHRDLPSDFPPNRWIAASKRVHGFVQPVSTSVATGAAAGSNAREHGDNGSSLQSSTTSSTAEQGGDGAINSSSRLPVAANAMHSITNSRQSLSAASPGQTYASLSPPQQQQQQQLSRGYAAAPRNHSHCNSNGGVYYGNDDDDSQMVHDSTSESESENTRDSIMNDDIDDTTGNGKRNSRQSNVVSAETWEKAMDAVEIHGMSLRNAAKAYGVHFAALHRRIKKRARQKEAALPLENYIPFEDEAGIVRVIHARADLGILMSHEEIVDLLVRSKLKYVAAVSTALSRSLIRRFQSRVEHSIRHLICDWPLPRIDSLCHFGPPPPQLQLQPRQRDHYAVEETVSSPPPRALLSPASHQQNGHHGISGFYGRASPRSLEPSAPLESRLSLSDPLLRPPLSMHQRENETHTPVLPPISSPHGVMNVDRRPSLSPSLVLRL
ncbi:DNA-binding protein, partial [Globisporangium splendens]